MAIVAFDAAASKQSDDGNQAHKWRKYSTSCHLNIRPLPGLSCASTSLRDKQMETGTLGHGHNENWTRSQFTDSSGQFILIVRIPYMHITRAKCLFGFFSSHLLLL